MVGQGSAPSSPGAVQIIQGYQKLYQVDLFYSDTFEPYDLTGATQIKAIHPAAGGGSVIEYLSGTILATTGDISTGSNQLLNLASTTGVLVGQNVVGVGIPANTTVAAISGTTVTLSQNATATTTGLAVSFTNTNVTVVGAAGAGKIQIKINAAESALLQTNPNPEQLQDLQIAVTNAAGGVDAFWLQAVLDIILPPYGVV